MLIVFDVDIMKIILVRRLRSSEKSQRAELFQIESFERNAESIGDILNSICS